MKPDRKENRWIPAQRLYDLKSAAQYLGRPVSSVRHLIYSGVLPVVQEKGPNGKMYLDVYDLDSYIESNKNFELRWGNSKT